ncbi:hypothetical protein ACSI5N_25415 (plasmid) [Raoultella ornithinolytica]|uniref:hypothetical protein n=1 Tax=Raoultella ornithinolytica TaxID=54291 RepID=UPI00292C2E65|nr:hypothetical protein [Raoultella ornithinolytica]MDV1094965.1 hypothetical protein [Raoultella ornithinolytica]MDV1122691.1 hypothetical protein [Raoultella ornithinolytica]MDV1893206.1 hypothetical protein [Raoultella ornithinolytica]
MSHPTPSKTQYRLMLAIASAIPTSLNPPSEWPCVVDDCFQYYGEDILGQSKALKQLCKAGILYCIGEPDDFVVQLADRDSFLLSWKAGAREARLGNSIDYIDYSDCPLAFAAGHMHWHERNKGRQRPYRLSEFDVCHGFEEADREDIWLQEP